MTFEARISEWGNLASAAQRKPGELKHLSTRRKRKQLVIPLVAASERGLAQTNIVSALLGL